MKRKALALALVMIVALSLATWFVYSQISQLQNQISELQAQNSELQDQLSELQNQLSELQNLIDYAHDVKIIAFNWSGGFYPVVGVTLFHPVRVTIKNMGAYDVSGLTLTVKLVYVETQTEVGRGDTKQIGVIHAGEILEFGGGILAGLGSFSKDSAVCVITLSLGNLVLDEWTRNLETVY
jgi:uncharacterized protein YigA (DUF484 family)